MLSAGLVGLNHDLPEEVSELRSCIAGLGSCSAAASLSGLQPMPSLQGEKSTLVVDDGPYSLSDNPLCCRQGLACSGTTG